MGTRLRPGGFSRPPSKQQSQAIALKCAEPHGSPRSTLPDQGSGAIGRHISLNVVKYTPSLPESCSVRKTSHAFAVQNNRLRLSPDRSEISMRKLRNFFRFNQRFLRSPALRAEAACPQQNGCRLLPRESKKKNRSPYSLNAA